MFRWFSRLVGICKFGFWHGCRRLVREFSGDAIFAGVHGGGVMAVGRCDVGAALYCLYWGSSVASGACCKGGCDDEWEMSGKVVDMLAFAYD